MAQILARVPKVKTMSEDRWRGGHILQVIIARTIIITVTVTVTITNMANSVS